MYTIYRKYINEPIEYINEAIEEIDSFDTQVEAECYLQEYRIAFGPQFVLWIEVR